MYRILTAATTLLFSIHCVADITVSDLPNLEGTPLEAQEDSSLNWNTLDYLETEAGIAWVWLQKEGQNAYLVYPGNDNTEADTNQSPSSVSAPPSNSTFTFPDTTTLDTYNERVNIAFLGEPDQTIHFTRFGGELLLSGEDVRISYSPAGNILKDDNTALHNAPRSAGASFDSLNIELNGDLSLNGTLSLNTEENIVLHGDISILGDLFLEANTNIELNGSVSTNGNAFFSSAENMTVRARATILTAGGDVTINAGSIGSLSSIITVGGNLIINTSAASNSIGNVDVSATRGLTLNSDSHATLTIPAMPTVLTRNLIEITGIHTLPESIEPIQITLGPSITTKQPTTTKKKSKGGASNLFILLFGGLLLSLTPCKRRPRES